MDINIKIKIYVLYRGMILILSFNEMNQLTGSLSYSMSNCLVKWRVG